MLGEITRVRLGTLPEDQLLAAVQALDPHVYSDKSKDQQLADLQYSWDWWNNHSETSASHSLTKLTMGIVMEAAKAFVLNLVSLAVSSDHNLLILM